MGNPKKGYKLITFLEEYVPLIGGVIRVLFYATVAMLCLVFWVFSGLGKMLPDSRSELGSRDRW